MNALINCIDKEGIDYLQMGPEDDVKFLLEVLEMYEFEWDSSWDYSKKKPTEYEGHLVNKFKSCTVYFTFDLSNFTFRYTTKSGPSRNKQNKTISWDAMKRLLNKYEDGSCADFTKTQEENDNKKEREGKGIKIRRASDKITVGKRKRGNSISSRRSIMSTKLGHNSYKKRAIKS